MKLYQANFEVSGSVQHVPLKAENLEDAKKQASELLPCHYIGSLVIYELSQVADIMLDYFPAPDKK
jgi:hypothetical protein